jgi:hypothetical protein
MVDTQKQSTHLHAVIVAIAISIAFFQAGLTRGQSKSTPTMHLSRHELHALLKKANTPEQYRTLEYYYLGREKKYEHEAEQEKSEWAYRQAFYSNIPTKSHWDVNSARNLYEHYVDMAHKMAAKAAFYKNKGSSVQVPIAGHLAPSG